MLAAIPHVIDFGIPRPSQGILRMKKFFSEKWPEILILVFVVPTFLFVLNLNNRVSKLEERTLNTSNRVDRIAQSLPDIRAKVAYEMIYAPFASALMTTQPFEDADTIWKTNFHVFDPRTGLLLVYQAQMKDKDDTSAQLMMAGALNLYDPNAISLKMIGEAGNEIKVLLLAPWQLSVDYSFIMYKGYAELLSTIENMSLEKIGDYKRSPVRNLSDLYEDISAKWLVHPQP